MGIFSPAGGSSSNSPDLTLNTGDNEHLTLPATAGDEDSYTFSSDVKYFRIRARGGARLRIAFTSGETTTKGLTVYPGVVWGPPTLLETGTSRTLYMSSSKASTVVEIETWT